MRIAGGRVRKAFALMFLGMLSCVGGCSAFRVTNPDTLVAADQVGFAVKAFMDASVRLLEFYGYSDASISVTPLAAQTNRLTGVGNKRDYTLTGFDCTPYASVHPCPSISPPQNFVASRDRMIGEYIYTGWQTAQILCRNYLAGLSEKNSAFDAIRKELNISGGLAQLTMQTAMAGARSIAYFGAAQSFLNATLDNFADYDFLTPDQAALQDLVLFAQSKLAEDYLKNNPPVGLVGAINAVHTIEFQCTRPGLRKLISRAVATGKPKVEVSGVVTMTPPEPAPTPTPRPTPSRHASPTPRPTPTVDIQSLQKEFTATKSQIMVVAGVLVTLQATANDTTKPAQTVEDAKKQISILTVEIANLNKRLQDLNSQAGGTLK